MMTMDSSAIEAVLGQVAGLQLWLRGKHVAGNPSDQIATRAASVIQNVLDVSLASMLPSP